MKTFLDFKTNFATIILDGDRFLSLIGWALSIVMFRIPNIKLSVSFKFSSVYVQDSSSYSSMLENVQTFFKSIAVFILKVFKVCLAISKSF